MYPEKDWLSLLLFTFNPCNKAFSKWFHISSRIFYINSPQNNNNIVFEIYINIFFYLLCKTYSKHQQPTYIFFREKQRRQRGKKKRRKRKLYNKMGWAHEMLIIFFISLACLADVIWWFSKVPKWWIKETFFFCLLFQTSE